MDVLESRIIIYWLAIGSFTLAALVCDLRTRKIPNWLTVPALLLGLAFHVFYGGWSGLKDSAAGFGLGFGLLLVLWLLGSGGAGDVKFMGALGGWLGLRMTFWVIVISTMLVALGSMIFLMVELCLHGWNFTRRRYMGKFNEKRAESEGVDRDTAIKKWRERRRIMPYALPVGLATWVILAWEFYRHPS